MVADAHASNRRQAISNYRTDVIMVILRVKGIFLDSKVYGAHLGPVGPRWAP